MLFTIDDLVDNLVDDFCIDVLQALWCKIHYPDSPVFAQKFKPYGSHFLMATVNYFKKCVCDPNEIIEHQQKLMNAFNNILNYYFHT